LGLGFFGIIFKLENQKKKAKKTVLKKSKPNKNLKFLNAAIIKKIGEKLNLALKKSKNHKKNAPKF
jgi:hypothetical protein